MTRGWVTLVGVGAACLPFSALPRVAAMTAAGGHHSVLNGHGGEGAQQLQRALETGAGEFPGDPVVRTWHFHCREPGFNSWSGN